MEVKKERKIIQVERLLRRICGGRCVELKTKLEMRMH